MEHVEMDLRVTRKTVQQAIVEKLREAIFSGLFLPGQRLAEPALCEMLGISRPSLREALRVLETERLVQIIPNKGTRVAMLTWDDAQAIYEVREMLEGEAAARCATLISDAQIAVLASCVTNFAEAAKSGDRLARVRAASEFYNVIFRNCGNIVIEEMLGSLLARTNYLRSQSMSQPNRVEQSLQEMHDVFAAISSRNSEQACAKTRLHVVNARLAAKAAFGSQMLPGKVA